MKYQNMGLLTNGFKFYFIASRNYFQILKAIIHHLKVKNPNYLFLDCSSKRFYWIYYCQKEKYRINYLNFSYLICNLTSPNYFVFLKCIAVLKILKYILQKI